MDEKIPELTLTPDLTDIPTPETKPEEQIAPAQQTGPDLSGLSPAEQKAVLDFAEKIDLTNSGVVLQYGAAAQKNIANFSESTLNAVRTKDMGELGDMVTNLLGELKGFSAEEEEKKGFFGMFKKASSSLNVPFMFLEVIFILRIPLNINNTMVKKILISKHHFIKL